MASPALAPSPLNTAGEFRLSPIATRSVAENTTQGVAQSILKLIKITTEEEVSHNAVYMSPADFKKMFTSNEDPYVEVASHIYNVKPLHWLTVGQIGVNTAQHKDLESSITDESILVSRFDHYGEIPQAHEIKVRITGGEALDSGEEPLVLSKLRNECQKALQGKVLKPKQQIYLKTERGMISLSVEEVQKQHGASAMGAKAVVNASTAFTFDISSRGNLVEKILKEEEIERLDFEVEFIADSSREKPPQPIVLDYDWMKAELKKAFENVPIIKGSMKTIIDQNGNKFCMSLAKGSFKTQEQSKNRHPFAFQMDATTPFQIVTDTDQIFFAHGTHEHTEQLEFRVLEYSETYKDKQFIGKRTPYLSVQELNEALKESYTPRTIGEKFYVSLSSGEYLVEIVSGKSGATPTDRALKKRWVLEEGTKIKWHIDFRFDLKLVDKADVYPLSKITINFEKRSLPDEAEAFEAEELEELMKEYYHGHFVKDQHILFPLRNGRILRGIVKSIETDARPSEKIYGYRGQITPETDIKFNLPEGSKATILPKKHDVNIEDLALELYKLGLGGISNKVAEIYRHMLLTRGDWSEFCRDQGIQSETGILIYGPPGTGKTAFAHALGKLLGGKGAYINQAESTKLLDKYVGESEKKLRELVEQAKKDWEAWGERSRLYVIVFDEIDAIIPKRKDENQPHVNSLVNQFLGITDGGAQKPKIGNLIIIGLTNRKDSIEPAALRPGRLGVHVELGLPDDAGRREILDIYTRKTKEMGQWGKVNVEKIIDATDHWSGAEIEALKNLASKYWVERLKEQKIAQADVGKTIETKLSQIDFDKALKDLKKQRAPELPDNTLSMYN